ncbi:MAG: helix-turn-helix domain-containing protein [Planctomycetes bacterium]|nr:helix-turn-helix domain-containing protein [Planctomycetota bacterium]
MRLLTCREAARYLGVCERTVWSLAVSGSIRSVRIGRSRRIDINDIDAFIERAKRGRP